LEYLAHRTVYGFMKEGASVVVFTHTENDNPRGDPDLCK
jgi:hypothetical protein